MTWIYVVGGTVAFFVFVQVLRSSSLNKDPEQQELFKKIIDEYKKPLMTGSDDIDDLEAKILKLLLKSKNSAHLVSMVKAYSSNFLSHEEARELYDITASLYKDYNP